MASVSPAEGIEMPIVTLLPAGPEQAEAIAALHAELFLEPWSPDAVRSLLGHPASLAMLAVAGSPATPVGFVMAQVAAGDGEILSIGVARPAQGHGIGQRLIEGLVRVGRNAGVARVFLEVAADNAAALALYRRSGFAVTGRRRKYYVRKTGAVDAVTMALDLAPEE